MLTKKWYSIGEWETHSHQGQDAFNASINSYGGANKGSAFLSPKSNPQRNATDAVGN